MASYYGIEKEDIAQGVDWNKIGKTYSDMLINERDRREKKKAEIDETIRQDLKTIEDMPQGKHRGVTDGLASLAEKLREQTLMYQRELKGGDLKLKDWTLQRQNLMDDTERVQKIGEGLQSQYGEIIKGFEDGELSQIQALQNGSKSLIYGLELGLNILINKNFRLKSQHNLIAGYELDELPFAMPVRHIPPNYGNLHLIYNRM